jgi:hypothetical protein
LERAGGEVIHLNSLKELFQFKFSKKQFLYASPQLPLLGEGGGRGHIFE